MRAGGENVINQRQLAALGGNLGVKAAYNGSRKMEFTFLDVQRERANQIAIGDYIGGGLR